ncbi:hypothetical protein OS493_007147 [Desmophyllum pertusum]|uniref:Uncharacterized protein n=1 Tax=Desmophyllum pertusum TaxID=174260 RepID=A0A9W9ZIT2_9CNID|nr:hypothetical protein OS493_007147 [Desmophyllum pertusum]
MITRKTKVIAPQNQQILTHRPLHLTMSMTPALKTAALSDVNETLPSKKAKLICQFFFSSMEGDFSWPVTSFPLHKINHRILSSLVWQVCEAIGGLDFDNGKKIEVSLWRF